MHTRINAKRKNTCNFMQMTKYSCLRRLNSHSTRLPYPLSYEMAIHCQTYCYHAYKTCNGISQPGYENFQFPVNKFWKILSSVFKYQKRRNTDIFHVQKTNFELFDKKLPARRVTVESRYFRHVVITTVKISLDIDFVIDCSLTVLIYAIKPKNSLCNMACIARTQRIWNSDMFHIFVLRVCTSRDLLRWPDLVTGPPLPIVISRHTKNSTSNVGTYQNWLRYF